jgi:hypothetical protein
LRLLKGIALDENQPTPLRLRAAELAVAIRSGEWQIASTRATQKAVRNLTAVDAIDRELLKLTGVVNQLRQETKRMADALETPEQRREREIDALLVRASSEKENKENQNGTNKT